MIPRNEQLLGTPLSRRRLMQVIGLGVASASLIPLLSACSEDDSEPDAAADEDGDTDSQVDGEDDEPGAQDEDEEDESADDESDGGAAEEAGGELVIAMFLEMTTLDPAQSVHVPTTVVLKNVIETLLELDPETEPHPRLAESWEVADEGREWSFSLKDGITFHDGTPFNADAVKFTYDRIVDPETQSQTGRSYIGPYESSEVLDDLSIRLTFSEVYAPLLHNLTREALAIISPAAVEEHGEEFGNNPVGTGPYVFNEWERGSHVTLSRYEDYVNTSELTERTGLPVFEQITIRFVLEHETRLAALRAGELDYMFRVPPLDTEDMREDPEFQVFENMFAGAPTMFLINRQLPPTDDLAVAQALQFAVNKDVITRIMSASVSPVAWGPLKPVNWGYNPEVETLYSYDPDQANALLDEAGWTLNDDGIREKDGQVARLIVNTLDDALRTSMLEAMQEMFREVGIDMEIITMSLAASEDLARQGENSLTFMDWRGTDPDILTTHYHSSNIGGWNMGYFDNEEVDELLDLARSTIDEDERLEMYERLQMIIMEEAATLPLMNVVAVDAARHDLQGVRFDATRWYPEWYDAYFEEE